MENLLIAIVVLLAVLVIGLLTILTIFLHKLLKMKGQSKPAVEETELSPEVLKAIEQASHIKSNIAGQFCIDHPELHAKGLCSISNEHYCELCLTKENEIKIARKYLDLLLDYEWEDMFMLNNEEIGPDKLNELIRIKKQLWQNENIPIITQKQFKINIENDRIEAYTMVKGRTEDLEKLQSSLNFLES